MSKTITEAIAAFPVYQWAKNRLRIYDTGSDDFYADCPVCSGARKLGISKSKKAFHCFKCNEGGAKQDTWSGHSGLIKFISVVEGISTSEAIQFIYDYVGFDPIPLAKPVPDKKFPKEAVTLRGAQADHPSMQYLAKRGLLHLQDSSQVCVSGHYAQRIILPCFWLDKIVGFEAKAYAGQTPKALYPDWFETSQYLYTTKKFHPELGTAIVTESIFDAETIGINTLGLYGSTLKEGQLNRLLELRELGIRRLVWFLDWDAWKKQAKSILGKTSGLFQNSVANVPTGQDPNSMGKPACIHALASTEEIHDAMDLLLVAQKFGREVWDSA